MSVFAHRARLVLGQLAVTEMSNEIPCVRALLKLLPRPVRWVVTVDAMHTQVATAKLIRATLKSHYLMIVKSNQAGLLARITALPWCEVPVVATRRHPRTRPHRATLFANPHRHQGKRLPSCQTDHPDHPRTPHRIHRSTRRRGGLRDLQPTLRAGPAHGDRDLATPAKAH